MFGSATDELIARGVRKTPLIGEQAAQGREELNATMSEIFGHVSDASRRRFEQLAERHNLSEADADNLGALGEALPQVLGIIGGPGRRRRRGDGHDGEDGSGDDPGRVDGSQRQNTEKTPEHVTSVARRGQHRTQIVEELPIEKLTQTHPVPRPDAPPNHIDNLAQSILETGFDRAEAIPVLRMPDGKLILRNGNHRLVAMRQLGEKTIPVFIEEWFSIDQGRRVFLSTQFPKIFGSYSID